MKYWIDQTQETKPRYAHYTSQNAIFDKQNIIPGYFMFLGGNVYLLLLKLPKIIAYVAFKPILFLIIKFDHIYSQNSRPL